MPFIPDSPPLKGLSPQMRERVYQSARKRIDDAMAKCDQDIATCCWLLAFVSLAVALKLLLC